MSTISKKAHYFAIKALVLFLSAIGFLVWLASYNIYLLSIVVTGAVTLFFISALYCFLYDLGCEREMKNHGN